MLTPVASTWSVARSAAALMYQATDTESARIRAAHLNAVLRLTPATMGANLGSATVVLWAFHPDVATGLWVWLAVLTAFCAITLLAWQRGSLRPRDKASPRSLNRATWHAAMLAGLWGVMTMVWFPTGTVGQQMTVATLVTGMIGAGGFVLSPLPRASLAYIGVFTLSGLWALWRSGNPTLAGVTVLIVLYSLTVAAGSLAAWRKATALIRAEAQSARQQRLLAVLLQDFEQQAGEAFWEIGIDGRLRHASPRLAELLQPAGADELLQPLVGAVERHSPDGAARLREALDAGRSFRDLQLAWLPGPEFRYLSFSGKRVVDEAGQTVGWRGVLADVSDKVRSEQALRRLAHTDSLTGLANRYALRDALGTALRQRAPVALLSVDLDHFKSVNDSHGHSAGDDLLRAVAQRLQAVVRPGDLVARLGGDEFAVLLRASGDGREPLRIAKRVVDSLCEPVSSGQRRLRVGASVGVAVSDGSDGHDTGVDDLLVRADQALYAAKSGGRGRHVLYSPELGEHSIRRLSIEDGLRQAIQRGELALHWQPKVDLSTWQITGAEALMRWTHPQLGRVSPAEFIAVAERSGTIDELGRWALAEACRAAKLATPALNVSVNVSPVQLRDSQFVAQVRQVLRETKLPPGHLELEITESVFIDDAEQALAQLHALRSLGVRVALDDFGTGYSSLSYLRRFPFDTLKIDRAFVNELVLESDARAIVQMMADLAGTLGMRTVCEGVETVEQLRAVSQAGCDQVQGYLISQPRPLAELLELQQRWPDQAAPLRALH